MASTVQRGDTNPDAALPQPITPLVGRVWEVAEAGALLRDPQVRLLTLTGPAGVGKTRLALRIAEQSVDDFPQGIVFVPLAAVRDPAQVVPVIAAGMGVPRPDDDALRVRLIDFLSGRRMLVLLDNFEQVIDAATEIGQLLVGAPTIKVMVTSRISLHISGEQEYAVAPLALPRADRAVFTPEQVMGSDAGLLFVQRARSVRPDFALTAESATAVAEICRRLDGLPLAIELAAARSKLLTPAALRDRLGDRLGVLAGGPRDAPERLRTMRAAIAWSYELLDDREQRMLRRLAVFAGGFGMDAAMRVSQDASDDVLSLISSLVDKSLLTHWELAGGEVRFAMLETIRDYCLTELVQHGEEADAHAAQARWLQELIEPSRSDLMTRRNLRAWLDLFEMEHDNIRTVLEWHLVNGHGVVALEICGGLFWFWYLRGHLAEGRRWIERSLSAATSEGSAAVRARANLAAAMMSHWQGDDAHAEPAVRHSIELAEQAGDEWSAAFGWGILGLVAEDSGRWDEAVGPLEKSLELAERKGFPAMVGLVLDHLGVVAWGRGDTAAAIDYWQRGLAIHREVGDEWGAAISLSYLGIAACERGDLQTALDMQRQSLTYRWEIRNTEDVAHGLSNLAMIAVSGGHHHQAVRLFATAETTHELIGNSVKEPERSIYQKYLERARAALGDEPFRKAWMEGKLLSLEVAVSEALMPFDVRGEIENRPFDLTAREMDVLRLMVEGLSDREIADQLFISPRTAQGHASHILGKLGVSSRTAATSLAIREGITTTQTT